MGSLKSLELSYENHTFINKIIFPFIFALLGAFLGFLDKYAGTVSWIDFDTSIEFWLVLITIVSVYSHTKWRAALYSIVLLLAMVFSYYFTYYMTLGFVPIRLFQGWVVFALLSSIYGFVIWHVKMRGILAALIGAIPIAILLQRGYYFVPDLFFREPINDIPQPYFGIDILSGFNFASSIILLLLFLKTTKSPKALVLFIFFFFIIFRKIVIFNYLYVF